MSQDGVGVALVTCGRSGNPAVDERFAPSRSERALA
jgi:hypothetical protein